MRRLATPLAIPNRAVKVGRNPGHTADDTGRGQPTWLGQLLEPGKVCGRPRRNRRIVEPHNITKALTESEDFFVFNNINRTDDDTGRGQPTWLGQLLEDGKVCGRPPRNRRIVEPNIIESPHQK